MGSSDTTNRLLGKLAGVLAEHRTEDALADALWELLRTVDAKALLIHREGTRQCVAAPWMVLPSSPTAPIELPDDDPILEVARRTLLPVDWRSVSGASAATTPHSLIGVFRAVGLDDGITIPIVSVYRRLDFINVGMPAFTAIDPVVVAVLGASCQMIWRQALTLRGEGLPSASNLTPREVQVLRWIKEGKSNRDIGTITGLSERAVEFHVANVLRKLDASSKLVAVLNAVRRGLLPL